MYPKSLSILFRDGVVNFLLLLHIKDSGSDCEVGKDLVPRGESLFGGKDGKKFAGIGGKIELVTF